MNFRRLFISVSATCMLMACASAQIHIDATGKHKKPRETTETSCGSIGKKLPVELSLVIPATTSSEKSKTVVEFTLTNTGKENLRLPVSPDAIEAEAHSPSAEPVRVLNLYLTSDSKHEKVLPGGASLFGNNGSSTLMTLSPGSSVRIRTEVVLPRSGGPFVGYAMLTDETITEVAGKSRKTCIGDGAITARSREYTLEALVKTGL